MQYVIIDPSTLIFDKENLDELRMNDYIDRILETYALNDYGFIRTLISENTIELLMSENDYPEWGILRDSLALYGLHKFYQAKDIISALEHILKNPTVESITEIKDVLFSIHNQDGDFRAIDCYLYELKRLYVYCYLNRLFVGPTLLKGFEETIIELNCEILELDCSNLDLRLPITVKEKIEVIDTLEKLLFKVDVIEIWKKNFGSSRVSEAIDLYLLQNNICRKKYWDKWDLGKELLKSMGIYGFNNEDYKIRMLLRAIAEIIGETNLTKTHALRESNSGASPQIKGKHGSAFRHDIDREYHMHYWKNDERIIFASVGPHNNFDIPNS